MTPKNEALAFRIWAFCESVAWNCTSVEVADTISEPHIKICEILHKKRWQSRLRVIARKNKLGGGRISGEALDARRELVEELRREGVIR